MSKNIFTLILLLFSFLPAAHSIDIDSLGKAAILHASHHNIKALRPVYEQMGNQMPHFIRLYCDIAIASSEGRHQRLVECVDSLKQWYPNKLQANTLLSLAELKAESLRQLGEYEALQKHCTRELKYFKRKRFKPNQLKELFFYQEKAKRLLGNSIRSQILQQADRRNIFELDTILSRHKDDIDEFALLRSQVVLFHTFRQHKALSECSRRLVLEYADSLDAKELTYCIETYADLLVRNGNWNDLGQWVSKVTEIDRSHTANLKYYSHLANALTNEKKSSISFPSHNCTIRTTYEWPMLIQAHINGGKAVNCFLETEQAHTLITSETATACQAQVLNDTITIASSNGIIEVSPTFIKELAIGEIIFNNILVYTVLPQSREDMPFDASLGTNEITRLGRISFLSEKMIVQPAPALPMLSERKGNLYMAEQNGLRIRSFYKGSAQPLSLDLGYPHNVLNKDCFDQPSGEATSLNIETTAGMLTISNPTYINEKIDKCNGILGTAFLRSYRNVTIDFNKMTLNVEEPTEYLPARGQFGHNTDKLYLNRNQHALTSCDLMDDEEKDFLELLINIGKNHPAKVVEVSQRLRLCQSPFYDAYTEAEGLFSCERYKEAVTLLEDVLSNRISFLQLSPSEHKVLSSVLRNYKLFERVLPVKITGQTNVSRLEKSKYGWINVKSCGKKQNAEIDIFSPYTEISAKTAKRLKVDLLGIANGIRHGIISQIQIGDFIVENVHCVINSNADKSKTEIPDKGNGIRLGWDFIRHFKMYSVSTTGICLSLNKEKTDKKKIPVYRLNKWIVETESEDGYPTYILDRKQNTTLYPQNLKIGDYKCDKRDFHLEKSQDSTRYHNGKISFNYLLHKAKNISFDLENMEMY